MDTGLLIIRLVIGATLAAHGAQKLFGWFGGYGLNGTGGYFDSIGFRPGKAMALVAGLGEMLGGIALGLGFLTPFAVALLVSTMVVAITVHAEKGFFAQGGGFEYPLILAAAATSVAFTGAGTFSVDTLLGFDFSGVAWGAIAVLLGAAGSIPPLAIRALGRSRAVAAA